MNKGKEKKKYLVLKGEVNFSEKNSILVDRVKHTFFKTFIIYFFFNFHAQRSSQPDAPPCHLLTNGSWKFTKILESFAVFSKLL